METQNNKSDYESPQVEIVEIKVERGFASSAAGDGEDIPIESNLVW